MGYGYTYSSTMRGLGITARDKETQDLIDEGNKCRNICKSQIQCDPPNRLRAYSMDPMKCLNPRCSCLPPVTQTEGAGVVTSSRYSITPRYTTTARTAGVSGLNESFLESLGSLGNLAIIGLAIYGGFCLAKKL